MEKENISILLIGLSGHGKSSLGNFLLGKHIFKVSDRNQLCTRCISSYTSGNLTIIDTPGFCSLNGYNEYDDNNDILFIKEIKEYINKSKNIRAILIVINSQEVRITNDFKNLIKMICNNFKYDILYHISFVFTKSSFMNYKQKQIMRESKKYFISETNKLIEYFYGKSFNPEGFHSFFIDSDLENIEDENSVERNRIIQWAKSLLYIKNNNEVNNILVLGKSGVGKTTFINTIIKSNIFKTSDGRDICTRIFQIGRLDFEGKQYSFIDTPGFDDPRGESEIEIGINKVISETPNIKCFILLFNIHEGRMDQSTAKLLEKLIKRFPIKNFWEHIIVVRTHVDENCRYGKRDRKENKNILLDFVKNYTIDEYYFGKSDKGGIVEDYEYNSTEFKKILNKINNLSSLN